MRARKRFFSVREEWLRVHLPNLRLRWGGIMFNYSVTTVILFSGALGTMAIPIAPQAFGLHLVPRFGRQNLWHSVLLLTVRSFVLDILLNGTVASVWRVVMALLTRIERNAMMGILTTMTGALTHAGSVGLKDALQSLNDLFQIMEEMRAFGHVITVIILLIMQEPMGITFGDVLIVVPADHTYRIRGVDVRVLHYQRGVAIHLDLSGMLLFWKVRLPPVSMPTVTQQILLPPSPPVSIPSVPQPMLLPPPSTLDWVVGITRVDEEE
jgi:hypothetical protein